MQKIEIFTLHNPAVNSLWRPAHGKFKSKFFLVPFIRQLKKWWQRYVNTWNNPRKWRKTGNISLILSLPDQICNSPYSRSYNSYNVSTENLVLDQLSQNWHFSLFSSLIWLILYWYCKEKFCLGHSGVKGSRLPRVL